MTRRQIKDITAAALFALATTGLVGAEGNDAKAASLLARLRQSLGGESKLAAVKGLTFEADMRRVLPGEGSEGGRGHVGVLLCWVVVPGRNRTGGRRPRTGTPSRIPPVCG